VGKIREIAENAWNGELGQMNVHPGMVHVGLEEFETDLAFMSAFSNVCVMDTRDGLVFIDTSGPFHAGDLFSEVRRWSKKRVHTAVYTHGHVDHVFGLHPFEEEAETSGWQRTHVIAHEACPHRFDRYLLTNGFNGIINQRQFGFPEPIFPKEYRYPDQTMTTELSLEIGGTVIELRHDKGETDDSLWAWIPRHKTLYTGDLFIWASPNCGNPQKMQRFPREWAVALRKMEKLGAEQLFPGHGPPILGADRVSQALRESAELLESLVDQTLAMMNQGAVLNDILHSVKIPEALIERPYLRPIYDDPLFIVRNLWRLYGGWYDGNPSHLKPAKDTDLARALAALAGGTRALANKAEACLSDGELALAAGLIEFAWQADPEDKRVCEIRTAIYQERAAQETSLMATAIFNAAARDSGPLS
jgi:alkyl sulfatase BDS1-like metallo-beta-lactamase superfamily hydrolase